MDNTATMDFSSVDGNPKGGILFWKEKIQFCFSQADLDGDGSSSTATNSVM